MNYFAPSHSSLSVHSLSFFSARKDMLKRLSGAFLLSLTRARHIHEKQLFSEVAKSNGGITFSPKSPLTAEIDIPPLQAN
jgi:hypothetical protein